MNSGPQHPVKAWVCNPRTPRKRQRNPLACWLIDAVTKTLSQNIKWREHWGRPMIHVHFHTHTTGMCAPHIPCMCILHMTWAMMHVHALHDVHAHSTTWYACTLPHMMCMYTSPHDMHVYSPTGHAYILTHMTCMHTPPHGMHVHSHTWHAFEFLYDFTNDTSTSLTWHSCVPSPIWHACVYPLRSHDACAPTYTQGACVYSHTHDVHVHLFPPHTWSLP